MGTACLSSNNILLKSNLALIRTHIYLYVRVNGSKYLLEFANRQTSIVVVRSERRIDLLDARSDVVVPFGEVCTCSSEEPASTNGPI